MSFQTKFVLSALIAIAGALGLALVRPVVTLASTLSVVVMCLGLLGCFLFGLGLRRAIDTAAGGIRTGMIPNSSASPEVESLLFEFARRDQASKRTLEECDSRRQQLNAVIDGLSEALVVVEDDLRIVMANESMGQLLDRRPADLVSRRINEVMRHPEIAVSIEQAFETGARGEHRIDDSNRSGRIFELHTNPLDGEVRRVAGIFIDVTRIESLEGFRKQFVANVSHELRTPLASIRAAVETLQDDEDLDDPQQRRRFLEIAARHAGRMGSLIEDLADLSRIESGAIALHPQWIELGPLIDKLAADLRQRHRSSRVEIQSRVRPEAKIWADRGRLEQILTNLLENAIRFNTEDGSVTIESSTEGRWQSLRIIDSGVGISVEDQEKIFQRFFRVDDDRSRDTGGTGLGLAITKHLVQLHGGRISVKSELGQGSEFIVELPGQPDEALTVVPLPDSTA